VKKVLIVVAEFLGHWGRSMYIAQALEEELDVKIQFTGRDPLNKLQNFIEPFGFNRISLGDNTNKDIVVYADRLEKVILEENPDLIILDVGLIPWCVNVRFPDLPIFVFTQFFMTPQFSDKTLQKLLFDREHENWNTTRKQRGLCELKSVDDIIGNFTVILADPESIIPSEIQFPDNYLIAGALVWEPELDLPNELENYEKIIYISIGSTGIEMPEELILMAKEELKADLIVAATPSVKMFSSISDSHFKKYSWLQASKILSRSTLAITQGGAGSSYQAFQENIPVAVWPFHRNHTLMGEYIEKSGAGILFNKNNWEKQITDLTNSYDKICNSVNKLHVGATNTAINKIVTAIKAYL